MKDIFYSHAKVDVQKLQSKNKDLRTRINTDPFQALDLSSDGMRAWLKSNRLHQPQATPDKLKEAVAKLELALGKPHAKRVSKKSNEFARVCTVRIKNGLSVSGPARRTTYKPGNRYDYEDDTEQSPMVSAACADIVREFLTETQYGRFVQTILENDSEKLRVYAHVDWYPKRTYQALTWHKDTRGSTLFVGLIYMNQNEIQGPDVIDNPWPLSQEMEDERFPKCTLPESLMTHVRSILEENKRNGKMQISQTQNIPAGGGMVWFIDELIHHRTPQGRAFPEQQEDQPDPLSFAVSERTIGVLPRLDMEQNGNWTSVLRDGNRKFVRLWVTLDEPEGLTS